MGPCRAGESGFDAPSMKEGMSEASTLPLGVQLARPIFLMMRSSGILRGLNVRPKWDLPPVDHGIPNDQFGSLSLTHSMIFYYDNSVS
jgi:hypothetical protein